MLVTCVRLLYAERLTALAAASETEDEAISQAAKMTK